MDFRVADALQAAKIVTHIHHEMSLHIEYCAGFGISKAEMEATEESQGMAHWLQKEVETDICG